MRGLRFSRCVQAGKRSFRRLGVTQATQCLQVFLLLAVPPAPREVKTENLIVGALWCVRPLYP